MRRCHLLLGPALALAAGCHGAGHIDADLGGAATVKDATQDAFGLPAPVLSERHRTAFFIGNSFFNQNWTAAPSSVDTRDGLGPLFNARSCSGCHFRDGRGRPPEPGEAMRSMLLRVSIPGRGPHGEPVGDAVYGDQIQGSALPGIPAEAEVNVEYDSVRGTFGDGEAYELRRPRYRLTRFGYGEPGRDLLVSPRVAPQIIGVGLLEAISDAAIRAFEDPDDRNEDGVSGRANTVWDLARGVNALGRFGWKAEQPTVLQQSGAAFSGDMGITSTLFVSENHTAQEKACRAAASGGVPEVSDSILKSVASYARSLGVPARRGTDDPAVLLGEDLFLGAGCTSCHIPNFETGDVRDLAELGRQTIHPFTDLLLHDMGDALADGRPAFRAQEREWRTPPLWGIGLLRTVNGHTFLLHDGRARNVGEAILWHGGEATASKDRFVAMSKTERAALIAFVESL